MADWMEPADRIIKFTHDILDFCASDPNLFLEMLQERENVLTRNPEKYHQTEDVREIANLKFEDYYIYSYISDHYQKKPLEVFLLKMLSKYNPKDQKILQGFQDNIFSSFTVSEVFPGSYFIVKDLISGNEYKIREDQSLFQMEKNDYFLGRILPYETGYVLSCVNLFLPEVPYYVARKFWGNLPKDYFNEINPLEIEKIFINQGMEGEYVEDNLDDIQEGDSPVARDVETFVSYFQENRIKVTKKNRWIPFKHLKIIEKNFINPEKDSFLFLGKEEETGKETRKKYIHFIHLLSRAERLIYHDKKGYVQVNQKHFKKFTKNNYGEKTIKLLLDWMEKVNWIKLQATEYTTFNAQEYQENIVGIWQFFYQLKPNEKKKPAALTKDIYTDPSRGQKELDEITEYLTHDVQSIILRYLKWFGVIDTQEEVIFPDLCIRSIKQFWVTPKGKKLVDRVVRYFWEKGEIKFSNN